MTTLPMTCPSSDERVKLFALLIETNARLSRSLGTQLEESCDLPLAWFEVLLQLRQSSDGRLKMNQIADGIVHSTGGTTRLIDRLEEAGLVERQLCPSDRRAIHEYLEENLTSRLNNSERATLTKLLTKLNGVR
jgi:DNA-binding MarR family transcriptional regulator